MSACFDTFIYMKGTSDEIAANLTTIKGYEASKDVYLESVRVCKNRKQILSKGKYLNDMSQDDIVTYIKTLSGEVFVWDEEWIYDPVTHK